ncbi:hypothetical protein Tco_0950909 [Tanacetum coccineum]
MANLKFADTHNLVTFLSKPKESDRFEQIVDFLNANPIIAALTVKSYKQYSPVLKQFVATVKVKTVNGEVQLHTLVDGKKIIINESIVRRDLQLEDAEGIDCLPNSTIFEQLALMGVQRLLHGMSLVTLWHLQLLLLALNKRRSFNFSKYIFESMVKNLDNVSGKFLMYPRKTKRKDTQVPQPSGPTNIVVDETVHKELGDNLVRVVTTASSLEAEKDSEDKDHSTNEIASLKRRVKKLEQRKRSRTHGLKRLRKVGMSRRVESSGDEDNDAEMFDVNTLTGDEVFAEQEVAAKYVNLTIDEVTLAQALAALKSVKPKDKGKGIMVEKPVKTMKKKDLIRLDEETAKRLQADFDEDERLAREKDEANVALIEEYDDIQAKIEADHELAQRLQVDEQEELREAKQTINPSSTKKNHVYLREEYKEKKPKDLKNKSSDSIQKMFDRAFKRVNTFVDFRTDLVEGSSKRAGEELEQESTKKQKVDIDKDTAELQSIMEDIPDEEEVAIDVVPLATNPPTIVDWKIHKEGKKSYYQIVRADRKSQMYIVSSLMLKSFSREDLEDLYKLVKAKYKSTRPVEELDLVLWSDLKTMFEPHVEDEIWKLQQMYQVLRSYLTHVECIA